MKRELYRLVKLWIKGCGGWAVVHKAVCDQSLIFIMGLVNGWRNLA